jgi:hypothetical protein
MAGIAAFFRRDIVLGKAIDRLRAEAIYRAGKLELLLPTQRNCEFGTRLIVN